MTLYLSHTLYRFLWKGKKGIKVFTVLEVLQHAAIRKLHRVAIRKND